MKRIALFALWTTVAGCVIGTEGKPNSVLVSVTALDGGACQLVNTGVDTNGDGVLGAREVTSSAPLCVSPAVQEKTPDVVLMSIQALDGGTCPQGGQLVSTGIDANGDGVLQRSEVTSSIPICAWSRTQSGEVAADWRTPGWTLSDVVTTPSERTFSVAVKFPAEFAVVPKVVVALREEDAPAPLRIEVAASAIDAKGFTLTVRTWDVSLVSGVVVSWLAYTQ